MRLHGIAFAGPFNLGQLSEWQTSLPTAGATLDKRVSGCSRMAHHAMFRALISGMM